MDYSTDLLKEIERKASEMMTPTEIAALLDIDEMQFKDDINTIGTLVRKAFFRGMATTAHELRKDIRDTAMAGSPHAIDACQKQIITMLSEVLL